ncbi:hypothetical protein NL676_009748 [Syzygium grande]|nr:hypothetical protein NL676_009748 [Syzygium grande]
MSLCNADYLDISGFFDGLHELELHQDAVAPEVDTPHGTDDDVNLPCGVDQAPWVRERALDEVGTAPLEGQQRLELLDVKADLWPLEDVHGVALVQACLHKPPPDLAGAAADKDLALRHVM